MYLYLSNHFFYISINGNIKLLYNYHANKFKLNDYTIVNENCAVRNDRVRFIIFVLCF